MRIGKLFQGSLFAGDLLAESIVRSADWAALDDEALHEIEGALQALLARFPTGSAPNESQTEDDLIWPVLQRLGWKASLRQQNLTAHGREDVPDGLLFADDAAKDRANGLAEEWRRYGHGVAVVESKRWLRPLDRRSGGKGEGIAPSTQMLRYLRRVDDLTSGALRWGILTNGARWRLYYQGARSVSEQFFEIDLAALLDLPVQEASSRSERNVPEASSHGERHQEDLFKFTESERRHGLKLFILFFRREAFLPGDADSRTLHQRALEEGRFHQERVASNLSDLVFGRVFPDLARAIAGEAPDAPLAEVRDAALVVLYRLLFILYAEDRDLLPVRDERYDDYGLRDRVRGDVGRRKDRDDTFSATAARYWSAIDDLCRAVDAGDPSIGLPPYDGGLFDRERAPLLERVRLGDRVMADVIDALSFETGPEGRRYINYRDLSVQQLGSIYERLLEHEVVRDGDEIVVRPNVFARKGSGSYYTPDELVGLILEETIGPLVRSHLDAFAAEAARLRKGRRTARRKLDALKRLDPATKLLDLKVCDPAMGSGHFLVGLVDWLADRVIAAMAEAEAAMEGYVSPLVEDIDTVRDTVLRNAARQDWTIRPEQLDDRHVVRRMVLKRCVYGVDKNPMAVELAKVSLWLHTFTAGAPLGFLDHHLRCGDSLFGAWVRQGIGRAEEGGRLFLHQPLSWAMQATREMHVVEMLSADPVRHRLRQDRRPLLPLGRDRGSFAGAVRLREPPHPLRATAVLPGRGQPLQVLCLRRGTSSHRRSGALRRLPSGCRGASEPRPPLPARGGRLHRGQSEHRHRPDLPHPAGRRADDRDLPAPAGARGPFHRRGGQDLAGEVRDDVPHDERLRPVPHPGGVGGAGRRLADRRQPLRQRRRGVGAALRWTHDSPVRPPCSVGQGE